MLSTISYVYRFILSNLDRDGKRKIAIFIFLMIGTSFAEILSIGAVIPFISLITNQGASIGVLESFLTANKLTIDRNQLIAVVTLIFILLSLIASMMKLMTLWFNNKIAFSIGSKISNKIFSSALYESYNFHTTNNSSKLISGVIEKSDAVIYGGLLPMLNIAGSTIILISILSFLVYLNPFIAFFSISIFAGLYLTIIFSIKRKLNKNSIVIAENSNFVIKILQESFGSIRDVILDGAQKYFICKYRDADNLKRSSQASNVFISGSPRYLMEGLGMMSIALLSYLMVSGVFEEDQLLPVLTGFALGAQKLLPIMQQIYSSWSNLQGSSSSICEIESLLSKPAYLINRNIESHAVAFSDEILINNIFYKYENKNIFNGLTIKILSGDKVGVIGKTGSGKSTLIDLIMGLRIPNLGAIEVDGITINYKNLASWQANISHVSQSIFLMDDTVKSNIAFGVSGESVDRKLLNQVIEIACLKDVINSMRNGVDTIIGEKGLQLSGGQRQRIGIARALYKNTNILILDEATSALDSKTESEIMENIYRHYSKLTLVMISHRTSTLSQCNKIINLDELKLVQQIC